jgi:neurotransmitter:Na+ symporter, NSS family
MAIETGRIHWSSRFAFILAAAGSAIGLGNLWKFPYITGVNGGGAFVLIYLLCIMAIGVPILIAELYIGQNSQKNAVQAFEETHQKGTAWRMTGWMGILSAFLILSFYSVVGGWILDFSYSALANRFTGRSPAEIEGLLGNLFASPGTLIAWHFVFMGLTVAIVAGGIKNGIERWAKILMPLLLILLGALLIRSFFLPGFSQAMTFLFVPDTSQLTAGGIMEAVGHAFFTLSLGMGAMITYGSYLSKKENLSKIAFTVAFMDTGIALLAGIVIFSIVFSFGMEAGGGPALMFQTLPVLFSQMEGGYFIALAFFLLLAFAALTSAVSLLEVVVTYWVETHEKSRLQTTLISGSLIFTLGILCALSFNLLSGVTFRGMNFFDLFDAATSRIFLPFGGLLIALFYGWVLGPKAVQATLDKPVAHFLVIGLLWSARVLAPLAIFVVLMNGLFG